MSALRQIDQVRVAILNRGWSTPWELQAYIQELFGVRISDATITARIRELRSDGLPSRMRRREGSRSFEYAIDLTPDVCGCRLLWERSVVDVGAALRTYRSTSRGESPDGSLFDIGPPSASQDTEGRRPDGGRRR